MKLNIAAPRIMTNPFMLSITNILLVNAILLPAVIFLHEIGHAITGSLLGCTGIQIVLSDFASFETFTRMSCMNTSVIGPLAVSGMLIVLPLAAMFAMLKGLPESHLAFAILGFNLMVSFHDYIALGMPEVFALAPIIAGAALAGWGEIRFSTTIVDRSIIHVENKF